MLQAYITVCEAVAYAHEHQVLHRDIKPDNIVLGRFGETVVLDWGLARRMDSVESPEFGVHQRLESAHGPHAEEDTIDDRSRHTGAESIIGTPQYMSHEQAIGYAGQRSDIFALGAVLYEILTGRPPYEFKPGEHTLDLLKRVRETDFPRPAAVRAKVPRQLEAVCLKAMAAEIEQRYVSAAEIAGRCATLPRR